MAIRTYISIITLNVNGLNAPAKRHRLAEGIQKQDPYICCLQETHFTSRDTYKLKVREWKKILHATRNQKKAGVAIIITNKIDFKMKNILRDKEGHYIMMKGKNLQLRLLYPARLSFRFEGEIKTFTDKQKLREFSNTKPALQQILKELL